MLNDTHPLGNHVKLFARLDTDLHEGMAVVRAESFRLRQFVPHDLARQVRIEWFAPAFSSRVGGD
ncbi:hypothetical protein WS92_23890 [Burkholderia sp. MSMB1588]|nr:hypothetical protein WS92_23890 [Burkholderia sp. MSMB1588]